MSLEHCSAISLERQQPVVSFDVRLGRTFERAEANTEAIVGMMRGLGMDDAAIANTNILLSADHPVKGSKTRHGILNSPTNITVYVGSSLQTILAANKTATYRKLVGFRTSLEASCTLAHELNHRAEHSRLGTEYLCAEKAQYLQDITNSWARLMRTGACILGGATGATEYFAGYPNYLVAGAAGAIALGGGMFAARRSNKKFGAFLRGDHYTYRNSPAELRARTHEANYATGLDNDDNPSPLLLCLLRRGEEQELLQELIDMA